MRRGSGSSLTASMKCEVGSESIDAGCSMSYHCDAAYKNGTSTATWYSRNELLRMTPQKTVLSQDNIG